MDEHLERFLSDLATVHNYSENTIAAYRNDLSQFMRYLGGRVDGHFASPNEVTATVMQQYLDDLKSRGYASSTVARKVAAVKSFFHSLVAAKQISVDPTLSLSSPKVKKQLPHILSPDEVEQLLRAPGEGHQPKVIRDRALLELLYATGMRVTEVVSLQLGDVNLETGKIRCRQSNREPRIIPIQRQRARELLGQYLEDARPNLAKEAQHTALFLNHRGQPLTRQGLWLIIKSYADQANVSGEVTPHTLRHSFARHVLNQGEDVRKLQELLGHANLSTTQVYTQFDKKTETGTDS